MLELSAQFRKDSGNGKEEGLRRPSADNALCLHLPGQRRGLAVRKETGAALTEDLHVDRGLRLAAILASDHTLVNAGVVNIGVVDGERGGGVIVPHHGDPLLVRGELLSVGGEPGDVFVFGISCH